MNKVFNHNADAPQLSQNDEDLAWAMNVLDEEGFIQNRRPQLLIIANWFTLGELRQSNLGDWDYFVAEDRVGDFSFRDAYEECKQVFGFDDTPVGRDVVRRITSLLGDCYPVWKLGDDGTYAETDLGPPPHAIDNRFIRRAPKKEAGADDFDVSL